MEELSIGPKKQSRAGQVTANGKIEHVFYAFSSSVIVFVEAKFDLTGNRREQAVAQVIAECDGLDLWNSINGYWCPILGVLSDGIAFQLFVYDSSTREVFCSEPTGALNPMASDSDFLKCIPLFVEVLGRHGPIIQRHFKTQSESI
jgi:hypothetical protein